MIHHTPLTAIIVSGLGLAFVFGLIAHRLRIPPIVGYLLAGVVVGPSTPGFVADPALTQELAEIGVMLLLFGVGLHFSLKDLLSVRFIAATGAIIRILVITAVGVGVAMFLGWTVGAGLVFGVALSVASTVVLLRALQERRLLHTDWGRVAVGWLIVEDLAMVLVLVLLPAFAQVWGGHGSGATVQFAPGFNAAESDVGVWGVMGIAVAKVVAFVALMMLVGRRVIPWLLHFAAHTGSRELFRLAVLGIALGVAYGAANLFGVSLALGAFFAGLVMSESPLSQQAAHESLPLRDAFAVLFFVSAGMLFNPVSILEAPFTTLTTLFIIVVVKSVVVYVVARAFNYSTVTALLICASLAQIGEFSFILADLGTDLGLLTAEGRDLIMSGAIMSMLLNPLLFFAVDWLKPRLERAPAAEVVVPDEAAAEVFPPPTPAPEEAPAVTQLSNHTVLVGYGRVGSLIGQALQDRHAPFLVIEDTDRLVDELREKGIEVIDGNGARDDIVAAARFDLARRLVLAIPNAFEAGQVVTKARAANPAISILARAHADDEVSHLKGLGADVVIMGEREIAMGIVEHMHLESDQPSAVEANSPR